MPTAVPETGTGATLSFAGFTAPILTLGIDDVSRESLETTILTTATAKTFMPADLFDPGSIPITFQFKASEKPPITAVAVATSITLPGGAKWAASAFMTDYTGVSIGHGIMEGSATLKVSGDWTVTS